MCNQKINCKDRDKAQNHLKTKKVPEILTFELAKKSRNC